MRVFSVSIVLSLFRNFAILTAVTRFINKLFTDFRKEESNKEIEALIYNTNRPEAFLNLGIKDFSSIRSQKGKIVRDLDRLYISLQ